MKIIIDKNSTTPLYKQIVTSVKNAVREGKVCTDEPIPSLNQLADEYDISMETVKKAYNVMKKENLIRGRQGKGFFIDARAKDAPKRIVMFLDKLSAYKLAIDKGLTSNMSTPFNITIHVHNQNLELFEMMINETVGNYDYYIVAPHFGADVSTARIAKSLRSLPNDRLILIDRNIPELKGHVGRIYQDFANDAADAIKSGIEIISKYSKVIILDPGNSLYAPQIIPNVKAALKEAGIKCIVNRGFKQEMMTPGTLFIVLGGQLDTDHFSVLREATSLGFTLGKSIGLITYNDEPVNEFICGGVTCLSTDFTAMGRHAAEMIESGSMSSIHNEFNLIVRNSL